jgi:ComF family protein
MVSLRTIGRAALDLLYPPRCALCGRSGALVCDACADSLPRADGARCNDCWLPLRSGGPCRACAEHPLALTRLRSAFRYEGEVRRLVHAFKFGGQNGLAPSLGALLTDTYVSHHLEAAVIVPVPLTGMRRRTRGYNQASLMAQELGRALDLPVVDALTRRRFPGAQASSATAVERWRNVAGAFSVARPEAVADKRVLLVDDVATTGATLDACARELLAAGAASVSGLTLARED